MISVNWTPLVVRTECGDDHHEENSPGAADDSVDEPMMMIIDFPFQAAIDSA
jgi:hypothetical protein